MRTAKTCGPDVPMLASTVATVHGSPGRARYKPESHCAGNVVCSPLPCMLMRALLVHVAHEIAGAARIRHSLRPLIGEGGEFICKPRAQCVARMRRRASPSSPRNGKAVVAGGASLAAHLRRWASLEG